MRRIHIAAVAAFGLVLFAGAPTALAQETVPMRATVSFPFMVGNVLLPAGTYLVVPDDLQPAVLEIQAERGRKSVFATILDNEPSDRRGDCLFQFVNVGGRYYLTSIDDGSGDLSQITLPEPIMRLVRVAGKTPVTQK